MKERDTVISTILKLYDENASLKAKLREKDIAEQQSMSDDNGQVSQNLYRLAIEAMLYGRDRSIVRAYRRFSANNDGTYMPFDEWKNNKMEIEDIPGFLSKDKFYELCDDYLYEAYKKDKEKAVAQWREKQEELKEES